jgi:transposase
MDASSKSDASEGERSVRRYRTLDEKLQILAEATRPGASMALVARKYGMNANLLFAWRRLQQQGLLESQRHAPAPLLPVKITAPTITPSEPSTGRAEGVRRGRPARAATVLGEIEILLGSDIRVRLQGEAQRAVLARVLEWLPRR